MAAKGKQNDKNGTRAVSFQSWFGGRVSARELPKEKRAKVRRLYRSKRAAHVIATRDLGRGGGSGGGRLALKEE